MLGIILGLTGLGSAITSLWLNLKKIDDLEWRFINFGELTNNRIVKLQKEIEKLKGFTKCK